MNETIKNQDNINKTPSRRRYIIAAVVLLLIISAMVVILHTQNQPDPASEAIIRRLAAEQFYVETGIYKEPNDLTGEEFAKIKKLQIHHVEIKDIRFLEKLTNLQSLDIQLISYPVPGWMTELAKLGIFDLKKRFALDLSPIKKLQNLQFLLIYTDVKDIEPFSALTNLKDLCFINNNVSDLEPIKELKNLTELTLCLPETINLQKVVSDLSPLENLSKLELLKLDGSSIYNIKPLAGLSNLKELELYTPHVSSIEPLKVMNNLRYLRIHNASVSDLNPLKELKNLETLTLRNTPVTNLEPLKTLTSLKSVDIISCNIEKKQIDDLQKALPDLWILIGNVRTE
jgi:Leucine-rich repeat (LRR) protein